MDYNPKDASKAWPKDDYDAALINVEEKISKSSGNPMEVWHIEVYDAEGKKQTIKEHVVVPGATFKIKQLAQALGKEDEFNAGTFQATDNIGANFTAALMVEEDGEYGDKNKVGRFKAPRGSGPKTIGQGAREKIANRPKAEDPLGEPVFTKEEIPF